MWIVVILAIVLGGFLFWVAIPWIWAHVSLGGGLLLSGSLLAGTPVTPDGQVVRKQTPPAPVTVVAPAPQTVTPDPEALRAAVATEVRRLHEQEKAAKVPTKTDQAQFNPPVVVTPDTKPCDTEFNPPVVVHPQRRR